MADKIIKIIYKLDQKKRVIFFQKNSNFSFEEEYFSADPLEMVWISTGRQFLTICDSIDIAIREAKGRIPWLEEEY